MEKVTLKYPVKNGDTEITEIAVRRPKVKDTMKPDFITEAEYEVKVVSNVTNLPEDVIQEMDLADYAEIQEKISNFLPEKLRIMKQ